MKDYQTIVIGAGAGGLVVAIGLAKAGKNVLLIERGHWGGDCTNYGCVPSKALISSAEVARGIQLAKDLGIDLKDSTFIADRALERVRKIVQSVRNHEDQNALMQMGVDAIQAEASFLSPYIIEAKYSNGTSEVFQAKKIVIATGSSPIVPKIEGLEQSGYLTNETIFNLTKVPSTLLCIGGGPIGSELAQAFQRLGSKVQLIHKHPSLLKREPECASKVLENTFRKEGIELYLNFEPIHIEKKEGLFHLKIQSRNERKEFLLQGDELLISVGRKPNLASLQLEKAKIAFKENGIVTDRFLRTSQKHVYAIGDVTGPPHFTHLAENHGRCVLFSLLLPFKKKRSSQPVPRVTYTDPEIASVGMLEEEAKKVHKEKNIAVYTVPFTEIDRAITQSRTEGFIQVVTKKWSSKILGVTIVGPRAGEMLSEFLVAMYQNTPLRKLKEIIHPYPTYSQGIRKAADFWLTKTIIPSLHQLFQRNKDGS